MTAWIPGQFRLDRRAMSNDDGQVGGIEAITFGLLIFLVGALIIVNVWNIIDAKLAVSNAAKDSVRAFVEAPDAKSADLNAHAAASAALTNFGRDASHVFIQPLDVSGAPVSAALFERCATITFDVSYTVPMIKIPFVPAFGPDFTVVSRHSEIVDPFRSNVPGVVNLGADCVLP